MGDFGFIGISDLEPQKAQKNTKEFCQYGFVMLRRTRVPGSASFALLVILLSILVIFKLPPF